MKSTTHCIECGQPLSRGVHEFSQQLYGYSLCLKDQCRIAESGATPQVVDLYLALKSRNFPVVLEYYDGFRHVDIALPGKLYIELNGDYEDQRKMRVIADLTHSVYALKKKIPTIIVSNIMLDNPENFAHIIEELSKACRVVLKPSYEFSVACAPPFTAAQLQ